MGKSEAEYNPRKASDWLWTFSWWRLVISIGMYISISCGILTSRHLKKNVCGAVFQKLSRISALQYQFKATNRHWYWLPLRCEKHGTSLTARFQWLSLLCKSAYSGSKLQWSAIRCCIPLRDGVILFLTWMNTAAQAIPINRFLMQRNVVLIQDSSGKMSEPSFKWLKNEWNFSNFRCCKRLVLWSNLLFTRLFISIWREITSYSPKLSI